MKVGREETPGLFVADRIREVGAQDFLPMARREAGFFLQLALGFREPLASQLVAFTNLMIIPEHVYAQGSFTKDHNTTAVGSGPRITRRTSIS